MNGSANGVGIPEEQHIARLAVAVLNLGDVEITFDSLGEHVALSE